MQLVVVDLIPALLSWEGRDPFPDPEAPPGTAEALEDLYDGFRLAAVTDADRSGSSVIDVLERLDLAGFFDSIGTSSVFGPVVSARVVRHLTASLDAPDPAIVVTARPVVAGRMQRAHIPVVLSDPGDPGGIPGLVADLFEGRLSR